MTTEPSAVELDQATVLNINVGVLGHVDSGKTSLVKALSTLLSTAALDKSKQSRQRGMTLDLGFSCFFLDLPSHWKDVYANKKSLQLTLVDCPGHASLIRTIIGGAQIIDVVLLVVDALKGWQAQTTECLVLAELTSPYLIVALNKVDQFADNEREAMIEAARVKVQERLKPTRFADAPVVGVSACVGGEKVAAASGEEKIKNETYNMDRLVSVLQEKIPPPSRTPTGPFYFSIDHCFPIRGRGTVLTGTVLSGSCSVNDVIEFPSLSQQRKVKSMQMFKREVPTIQQGDRAGLCVSNLDAALLERGMAAQPGAVQLWKGAIAVVRKVQFYSGSLPCNSKFHISVGHSTVMATVTFWGARELAGMQQKKQLKEKGDRNGALKNDSLGSSSLGGDADLAGLPRISFDFQQDFLHQDELLESLEGTSSKEPLLHWALLDFQTPVYCPVHSLVIGSRLDTVDNASGSASSCRLAFSGRLTERIDPEKDASRVRLYTLKERRGVVARLGDPHRRTDDDKVVRYEVFGSDLFKKETDMKVFLGMKIVTEAGDIGEIKSSFGTSGHVRVYFPAGTEAREGDVLILKFKRFTHDPEKAMHQDLEMPAARSGMRMEIQKKQKKKREPGVNRFGEVASLKGDILGNGKHNMAIISGFFAPEVNIKDKAGTKVLIASTHETGAIVGPFGKAGKCKVAFEEGISAKAGDKAELQL
jgi:selenocysteine-specific elongation factor